jgi:hypothetical protein
VRKLEYIWIYIYQSFTRPYHLTNGVVGRLHANKHNKRSSRKAAYKRTITGGEGEIWNLEYTRVPPSFDTQQTKLHTSKTQPKDSLLASCIGAVKLHCSSTSPSTSASNCLQRSFPLWQVSSRLLSCKLWNCSAQGLPFATLHTSQPTPLPQGLQVVNGQATQASTSGLPGEPRAGRTLVHGPLCILALIAPISFPSSGSSSLAQKAVVPRVVYPAEFGQTGYPAANVQPAGHLAGPARFTSARQRTSNVVAMLQRSFSYFPCISSTVPVFLEQHVAYPAKLGPTPLGCPRDKFVGTSCCIPHAATLPSRICRIFASSTAVATLRYTTMRCPTCTESPVD